MILSHTGPASANEISAIHAIPGIVILDQYANARRCMILIEPNAAVEKAAADLGWKVHAEIEFDLE